MAAGKLPWHGEPDELVPTIKRELLTSSSPAAALTESIDCPTAAAALQALFAEVRRCRGKRREDAGAESASVDYEACMAALTP